VSSGDSGQVMLTIKFVDVDNVRVVCVCVCAAEM